ncbi:MAG: acetyl-CoA decarbonylase/synthase complex subunit gamma [Methanomicrobiaceae archaeon]|nr:acetyl-CoA decarbonylase/synthase complex subunit gamma [Methanomicrobiaceae archaeon]
MALKALDIYKLLPKTNCKKCGYPTCLAFAMKLAAGQADVNQCPDLDEETRALLGGATRPPILPVRVGVGERSFVVGEEYILYRHEKTFYHQPGIIFMIDDTMEESVVTDITERVLHEMFPRVGQELVIDGIGFCFKGGDAEVFGDLVGKVEQCASLPEVIYSTDPEAQEAALLHCGNFRPLIYAATWQNYSAMCKLATRFGCPLAVKAEGIEGLRTLVEKCKEEGAKELMLDPSPKTPGEFLRQSVAIRRLAIERSAPELGYPVVCDASSSPMTEAATAVGILKYAGVILTPPLPPASTRACLTLRQNIYTDPQKPIQVTPGIYPINDPGRDAPVLMTVNFSLTYFTLLGYLEASKIPCYLFIVDTEGLSVLTAVAGGKLTEEMVEDALKSFDLGSLVDHTTLIIPGYAAPLSGKIEEATGWKVMVGPRDAADIGGFLEKEWRH